MSSRAPDLWVAKADELLADGLWHDGRQWLREVEKAITPGVAVRRIERQRERNSRVRNGEVLDRQVERPLSTLIAMGKLSVVHRLVSARIRSHSWQVDPWPIPKNGWRTGGWRIRDPRAFRRPLSEIGREVGIDRLVARQLLDEEPPIEHVKVGRVLYVYDVAGFTARVQEYRSRSGERRSVAMRQVHAMRRELPHSRIALTVLARESHLSTGRARILADGSPELGWIARGRVRYLPLESLPMWEKVVAEYLAGSWERRSAAMKMVRARNRREKAAPTPIDPISP